MFLEINSYAIGDQYVTTYVNVYFFLHPYNLMLE